MANDIVRKSLELAVQTERDGAEFYSQAAQQCLDTPELQAVFTQLSKDEKAHEVQFTAILNTLGESSREVNDDLTYMLKATGASDFFKKDLLQDVSKLSAQQVLLRALDFEKATLLHYAALRDSLGDVSQIESLIKAEKSHVVALMKVLMTEAKFRSLSDNW
jgi:rubrerythrin